MARDGYLILDSDLHMMEPDDLWARYLEGPHRGSPPRFFGGQQQKLSDSSEDKGHADQPCSYRQCVTIFTEELPWLQGRDKELVMGDAICDWLGWKRPA